MEKKDCTEATLVYGGVGALLVGGSLSIISERATAMIAFPSKVLGSQLQKIVPENAPKKIKDIAVGYNLMAHDTQKVGEFAGLLVGGVAGGFSVGSIGLASCSINNALASDEPTASAAPRPLTGLSAKQR